ASSTRVDGAGTARGMRLLDAAGASERERTWASLVKVMAGDRTPSARGVRTMLTAYRQRLGIPNAPARTTRQAVQRATAEAWAGLATWERDVWRDYRNQGGPTADVTGADGLRLTAGTRLAMALRIAPKCVKSGARESFEALVNDAVFLGATTAGITAYFALWLAPEPIISKAGAVLTTIGVVALVGCTATEIITLARAWM